MSQTTMSIRVDSNLKQKFDNLCNEFGLSVTSAFTIFMNAVVRERRIPFEIRTDSRESEKEIRDKGIAAFLEIRKMAEQGAFPDMTLEEINEEIRLAREGK
ncbi:MAG: type II toxin-antitoxin system RelB/DinJ family antitoxin [Bacteroidales bacterium]|jgi:addiction module RelB/DinJ family antitoxin|nr:type II toxin-antitoxin system RelB/DinJ family antitoxin [Bacteroidales bacterium]